MPPKIKGNSATSVVESDSDSLCFSSDNVIALIDRITANFTSSFNLCVDRIVSAIEKKFEQCLECQSSEIFDLNKRIDNLERLNKISESLNTQLNDRINK